jgi:hypothetical protein
MDQMAALAAVALVQPLVVLVELVTPQVHLRAKAIMAALEEAVLTKEAEAEALLLLVLLQQQCLGMVATEQPRFFLEHQRHMQVAAGVVEILLVLVVQAVAVLEVAAA